MVRTRHERLAALVFVAPATALIAACVLWPTVQMVLTSFRRAVWGAGGGAAAGVRNYADLLADPVLRQSLWNTAVFTGLVVPLQAGLALLLAVWGNGPGAGRRFLRLAVFLPTALSLTVVSVVWKLMYEPASATGAGLVNGLLAAVGLPPQPLLTSPRQALPALVVMSVWQGVGLQMLVFLAGLQQVPAHLYEAARLDGAGRWRQFLHVTLPGLAPTTAFVLTITTIFALKLFVQPFVMTRGGPQGATRPVVQYVYEAAFFARDLGLACAAGTVFLLLVLLLTVALRGLFRATEHVT